ncbi:NAD-dependent epimerase/dehydratase family protein [Candidatus Woesearchaeota archaeon]|nr:NAD-dependent epimerase/dehydratase family protein [Candidatus Woesearchaeota archaeon]
MRLLITGGGGFLGKALAKALVKKGHQVRSFSRGDYPELRALGIEVRQGDIADENSLLAATEGCDAVFHVAAKAGVWGSYEEYYKPNVLGTKNVINACIKNKVKRLIFTSSPSVVFDNASQDGVNESEQYPKKFLSYYPKTKAIAEKLVLKANSPELATVSLRPHLIWGPGDNHLIPRIISRAKSGKLRIVGDGKNLVDTVYIDNVVDAHVLALEKLSSGSSISGKAYFITNGEPLPMAVILNKILKAAELPPVNKKISVGVAYAAGALMEFLYSVTGRKKEPLMTRFVAKELSCAHWFDISAAKRDLGYEPSVSIDEGMQRLKEWLQQN